MSKEELTIKDPFMGEITIEKLGETTIHNNGEDTINEVYTDNRGNYWCGTKGNDMLWKLTPGTMRKN